ncbi:MAG: DUF3794 domain-containing protein [Limnochordales bacterium]|nr:DUF3794 domain-containing protein [Limnochordales bacterium]
MLRLEETRLNLERTYGEQLVSAVATGPVRLGSGEPSIGRVLGLRAVPRLTQLAWTEGQARARGVVDLILIYEEAVAPANEADAQLAGFGRQVHPGGDELPDDDMSRGYEEGLAFEDDQDGREDSIDTEGEIGTGRSRSGGRSRAGRGEMGTQPAAAELASTIWREALTFEVWADLPGADLEPPAELQGRCEVETTNFQVDDDGRGAEVEVGLAVLVRAFRIETVRLVTGMNAGSKSRLRLEGARVALENFVGRAQAEALARREIALAVGHEIARQIVDVQVQPRVEESRVVEGGVDITGKVELNLLYLVRSPYDDLDAPKRESQVRSQVADLRWQAHVDLPGARAGHQAGVEVEVAGMRANLSDDGRSLAVGLTLALDVRVVEPVTVTLLQGVHGDGIEVATQMQPFTAEALVGGGSKTGKAEGEIEVADPLPGFDRVFFAVGQVHVDRIVCGQDRVEVEGAVDVNITYLADNWEQSLEVATWPRALEFREIVVIAGVHEQDIAQVRANLHSLEITPRGSHYATARAALDLEVQVFRPVETEVVADAVEVLPLEGEPPTMRFVVVQPDDTLWRLATRYSTTPEALLQVNPELAEGELPVGHKVYIPRRIVRTAASQQSA